MSATTYCLNGSLLTLFVNICAFLLSGEQCRINNSESECGSAAGWSAYMTTYPSECALVSWLSNKLLLIIIIIMEAFIKRRIPGKTTCSKALQYNSNKVVIKLKLY